MIGTCARVNETFAGNLLRRRIYERVIKIKSTRRGMYIPVFVLSRAKCITFKLRLEERNNSRRSGIKRFSVEMFEKFLEREGM